ncbi:hypothetical protein [Arthrobacter sp. JCM 19049]|uniref:hypothetical protein n=1 Tax=Arthrobacter sp. JCM 19049 TaxID=1460643 RepID=UPI000B03A334|nr:hypothetical protein [Arthrobacter sp. JCM 19049]
MSDSKPAAAGQTGSWHVPAPTDGDRVWSRVAAYVRSGDFLLHGSRTPGLHQLTPRTPIDHSPDTFSKSTAVFATEDPTWAIAYAVRPANTPGFLNACFYPGSTPGREAERRIFLSFALPENGQPPMDAGVVYVLPAQALAGCPVTWIRSSGDHRMPMDQHRPGAGERRNPGAPAEPSAPAATP